jgi:hypothetical protein
VLCAAGYDFDRCDLAGVEPTIRKQIKVKSKITLRFADARNAPIVVSAIAE